MLQCLIDPNQPYDLPTSEPDSRGLGRALMALISTALARVDGDVECRVGGASAELDNHEVRVEICTEVGGNSAELLIVVEGPDQLGMARSIALCLVGIPPEVWHVLPGSFGFGFHAELTLEQIYAADQPAWQTAPDRPSHIVLSRMLSPALVIGTAMRALCGLVFRPPRLVTQPDLGLFAPCVP